MPRQASDELRERARSELLRQRREWKVRLRVWWDRWGWRMRLFAVLLVVSIVGLIIQVTAGFAVLSAGFLVAAAVMGRRQRGLDEAAAAATRLRKRRQQTLALDELLKLTPAEFEREVAMMLELTGILRGAEVIGGANDVGVDILGRDETGATVVVQCKRYTSSNKVGSPELQGFLGAREHRRAVRAICVTTSTFTAPAMAFALANGIEMCDGTRLSELARRAASVAASREVDALRRAEPEVVEDLPAWTRIRLALREPRVLYGLAAGSFVLGLLIHASVAPESAVDRVAATGSTTTTLGTSTTEVVETSTTTTTVLEAASDVGIDDGARLNDALSQLADAVIGIDDAVVELPTQLDELRSDLATVVESLTEVQALVAESPEPGAVCVAAGQVRVDAAALALDQSQIETTSSQLASAVARVRSAQEAVRAIAEADDRAAAARADASDRVTRATQAVESAQAESRQAIVDGAAHQAGASALCDAHP